MHFYGGGYCDIKTVNHSWLFSVVKLAQNEDAWAIGYKEIGPDGVPNVPDPLTNKLIHDNWHLLIGNGAYIFKPETPLTSDWYHAMIDTMDANLANLKKYPARHPQEVYSEQYPYPFRWAQLLGEIFHPICYKYHAHVLQSLPPISFNSYK